MPDTVGVNHDQSVPVGCRIELADVAAIKAGNDWKFVDVEAKHPVVDYPRPMRGLNRKDVMVLNPTRLALRIIGDNLRLVELAVIPKRYRWPDPRPSQRKSEVQVARRGVDVLDISDRKRARSRRPGALPSRVVSVVG